MGLITIIKCPVCDIENDSTATFCKNCGAQLRDVQKQDNRKFIIWICILASVVLGLVIYSIVVTQQMQTLASDYQELEEDYDELDEEYDELDEEYDELDNDYNTLIGILDSLYSPIIISKIEVKNSGEEYNRMIYSYNTTYIYAKIHYFSTKKWNNLSLKIKFYRDNALSQGSSSPSDCSFTVQLSTEKLKSSTFAGISWGGATKGHWSSGDYRYEVWYEDKCLGVKHFKIY